MKDTLVSRVVPPVVHDWRTLDGGDDSRSRRSEHARGDRDRTDYRPIGSTDEPGRRRCDRRRRRDRRPADRRRGGRQVCGDVRSVRYPADRERDRPLERVRRLVAL